MIIHGIQIMEGQGDRPWSMANLIALPVMKPFENTKIRITGSGFVPKTDSQGKPAFPHVKVDYAHKIVKSGAFVANKDYEVLTGMDEETLETIVVEIIPTDPQLKQHFQTSLKEYEAKGKA